MFYKEENIFNQIYNLQLTTVYSTILTMDAYVKKLLDEQIISNGTLSDWGKYRQIYLYTVHCTMYMS